MAEVFGAVASGIGIAGVAAQALDGIRKLQAFCKDVLDAPEEIKYLANELEILLGTIASIEAQIQRNSTMCRNMDPTPALRFVDQSVRSLSAIIEGLNTEIAQKRTLGSMKMAWKKKVLESHLMKIERSKTSLGLAVSAYSSELYLQTAMNIDTKIDQLNMNVTTLTASCQARLEPSPTLHIYDGQQNTRDQQLPVLNGDDRDWQNIRKRTKPLKRISVVYFTLTIPLWLAQRSLQIDLRRTARSWTLSLRPYRTISYDADIWEAIRQGDFDRMQGLIESGQATVFDRLNSGWTLLHAVQHIGISARSYERETSLHFTRFLIDRGADVNEPSSDGVLPIHTFCGLNLRNQLEISTDPRNDDILRILGDEFNLDVDSFWQLFRGAVLTCSATIEKELKRHFPLDTLNFPTITMANRLRDFRFVPYWFSPQDVASYIGFESLETAFLTSSDDSKCELLRIALQKWGLSSGHRVAAREAEEWQNTIRDLFASGARLRSSVSGEEKGKRLGGTEGGGVGDEAVVEVLCQFVIPYVWAKITELVAPYVARDVVNGFKYFVSKTEHLGIRLEARPPCRRFELCFDHEFVYSSETYYGSNCWWQPHDFSLYYDDGLSIWVLWDSMYEAYCGEFWDLIDHSERMMPGTWID